MNSVAAAAGAMQRPVPKITCLFRPGYLHPPLTDFTWKAKSRSPGLTDIKRNYIRVLPSSSGDRWVAVCDTGLWILNPVVPLSRPHRSISCVCEREKERWRDQKGAMVPLQPFSLSSYLTLLVQSTQEGDWGWRAKGIGAEDGRTCTCSVVMATGRGCSCSLRPVPSGPTLTTLFDILSSQIWILVVPRTGCEKRAHYLGFLNLNFLMDKPALTTESVGMNWCNTGKWCLALPDKAMGTLEHGGTLKTHWFPWKTKCAFLEIQGSDFSKRSNFHYF